ncbi:MAG: hypothetical protein ABIH11_02410 [Candidatus Altiarchaeota archaeon]
MSEDGESGKGWWRREYWNMLPVLLLVLMALFYFMSRPETTTSYVSGVRIVSEIPMKDFQTPRYEYIALYNTTNSDMELTCKFGLSAISQPSIKGYKINIESGETGVYLGSREAWIRGASQQDLLDSCHAFICAREGIDCPEFSSLRWFIRDAGSMSVILDSKGEMNAGRGYAEIVGVLSFMQSKRVDVNGDGIMNQSEIDANEFFIYPFLMENGTCSPQPFHTLVENWTGGNESYDCAGIAPSIVLEVSDEDSISVEDGRIILRGDDRALHAEAIILRDNLAPEWIRRLYGFK